MSSMVISIRQLLSFADDTEAAAVRPDEAKLLQPVRCEPVQMANLHHKQVARTRTNKLKESLNAATYKVRSNANTISRVAISISKLPIIITRPQKSYHPNIRLLDTAKLCIQLMCLLAIVPINYLTHALNHNYHQQQIFPTTTLINNASHLFNHRLIGQANMPQINVAPYGHATPPILPSNHHFWPTLQQQQQPPVSVSQNAPVITSQPLSIQHLASNSQMAQRRNELQQQQQQQPLFNPYQAYQLQPVRPAKLMAEYVANQGQRILKNLVNTTIADLVVQSTMKMNANKLNAQLNGGPSTTIGKLYTLLFPTPSPLISFSPIQQTATPAIVVTSNNHTDGQSPETSGGGEQTSNSSNDHMYLNEHGESREEKHHHHPQILSLSAPYDSQPRSTLSSGRLRSKRLHNHGSLQQVTESRDEWRRPQSDADLTADPNPMIFDHQQLESVGSEEVTDNGSPFKAAPEMGDSLSSYDLMQQQQLQQHQRDGDLIQARGKSSVIREAELYASSHNIGDHAAHNHAADTDHNVSTTTNFAPPEVDFSSASSYGRAHTRSNRKLEDLEENQYDLTSSNHTLSHQQLVNVLNNISHQGGMQTQEPADAGGFSNSSGDSSSVDGRAEFTIQLPPMRSQRQPKHYQHKHNQDHRNRMQESPADEHAEQFQHHDMQEHDIANQQILIETRNKMPPPESDNMSIHGNYATEEPSSTSEQAALKGLFSMNDTATAAQHQDDSFFSANLPSKYDAVMRLPPAGYYDDYFKPSTVSGGQSSLHSEQPFINEGSLSSMTEFPSISSPSHQSSSSPISRKDPTAGVPHYVTVLEELHDHPNAANYSSDGPNSRQRHSVPSYQSQIIMNNDDNNNNNSYSQPTIGYTKQYYIHNQQQQQNAMKQNSDTPSDAKMEFIAANTSLISEGLNYEIPSDHENQGGQHTIQVQNITLEPNNEQYVTNNNSNNTTNKYLTLHRNLTLSSETSGTQMNSPMINEDSIKLIIANTISGSRDPKSNEKVINYTSDGFNITRGNSPRNNFVNKDMNEFPPVDVPTVGQQLPEPQQQVGAGLGQAPINGGQVNQQRAQLQRQQQQPAPQLGPREQLRQREVNTRQQPMLPQYPRPNPMSYQRSQKPPPLLQEPLQLTTEQPDTKEIAGPEEEAEGDRRQQDDTSTYDQFTTKQRGNVEPAAADNGEPHSLPQAAMGERNRKSPRTPQQTTLDPHEQHHNEHQHHVEQQLSADQLDANNEGTDRNDDAAAADADAPPSRSRSSKQRQADQKREDRKRERRARNKPKFSKQHTMPRPQITQVNFNPKDLNLRPHPNALASASESPLEAIARLPHKLEQLRENQPDKDELMNELLTALDRVKVAIYKLQPLTAKMNAIYRKSVTSNTRDIIMDNHKGTYAKRYPPGDYDDSYDPMHPSERFINRHFVRQRNDGQNHKQQTGGDAQQHQQQTEMDTNESVENAVYLPAPKEVLEMHKRDLSDGHKGVTNVELDSLNALESKIVATGIGRRLGYGRIMGQLSLASGSERLTYDDEDTEETSNSNATTTTSTAIDRSLPSFFPPLNQSLSDEDIQEPLFGYRITIYRSPEAEAEDGGDARPSEQFVYQVDDGDKESEEEPSAGDSSTEHETDLLATSESSLVSSTQQPIASEEHGPIITIADPANSSSTTGGDGDILNESESKSKKMAEKKKMKKSKESKKKKNEEESKKKKEYKKIKHNKGIISKEKKTMHRDKHIKAHDRGAAKEKALKERTQIEFFEREQIVDDEFEKGKKSTIKGGWQSGQDSKKSIKEGGGDTMSSGGSHFVKHEPKETDKGHKVSAEASSAKKSNKFEKKQMEAKGKKFKGWREKGYKIITETEFIDRGSLHDSAYKKRDKGAAHHQKFKKQEASSEGHHGSMLEHHKKVNKKEEKKSDEKKGDEMKKKTKPKQKKKKEKEEEQEESAIAGTTVEQDEDPSTTVHYEEDSNRKESKKDEHKRRERQQQQPMLMSATSSTFRPTILIQSSPETSQTRTLIRLINSNVHESEQQPNKPGRVDAHQVVAQANTGGLDQSNASTSSPPNVNHSNNHDQSNVPKYQLLNDTITGTNRRSDMSSSASQSRSNKNARSLFSQNNSLLNRGNATILNIVDNLTGRQINKTKIGTYDLEDHHTIHLNNSSSPTLPLVKISNGLAKYFPFLSQQAAQLSSRIPTASNANIPTNSYPTPKATIATTTTSTTTTKPNHMMLNVQIKQPDKIDTNQQVNRNNMFTLHNHILNYNQQQAHSNHNHNFHNQAHENHQPHHKSELNNHQIMINRPVSTRPMDIPTTRMPSMITPEQANAAAQLLQLVHRASQVNQVDPNLTVNHQPANIIDFQHHHHHQQQLNPLQSSIHRAAFTPPTMTNSFQPAPIFAPQINFVPPTGPGFGADQLLDYENDPVLQHQSAFI